MGIREIKTAFRSPQQNSHCERVIGTIRRECTDHIIALNEKHLRRILNEYVEYYNESRTHLALDKNAPIPRKVEPNKNAGIVSIPYLGGLHHRYKRAA